jgi:hypothetical protein
MRFLIRHDELNEDFADALCGLVLGGVERQARSAAASTVVGRK